MAKRKLQRFAEVETFENVFYVPFDNTQQPINKRGQWNKLYFKNNNPIVLELGCGKGEYTVGMAQMYPDKNFIGIDIKGNRIWRGAKTAIENKINNVAFIRTRIDFIERCFAPGEISEIWITFPDPQPNKKGEKKRLTATGFLNKYKNILQPYAPIHLKTDSVLLYNYTLDVLAQNNHKLHISTSDLYSGENEYTAEARLIKTHYEKLFLSKGIPICYLRFSV